MIPASQPEDPSNELIEFGGPIDRTTATLRIAGDDLDPSAITELLGFPPTLARRKGDSWQGARTNRKYTASTGQWNLESPEGTGDINSHLSWILETINSEKSVWIFLQQHFQIDIFCGLFLEADNRTADISANLLKEIGQRGIDLAFDIYSRSTDQNTEQGAAANP